MGMRLRLPFVSLCIDETISDSQISGSDSTNVLCGRPTPTTGPLSVPHQGQSRKAHRLIAMGDVCDEGGVVHDECEGLHLVEEVNARRSKARGSAQRTSPPRTSVTARTSAALPIKQLLFTFVIGMPIRPSW